VQEQIDERLIRVQEHHDTDEEEKGDHGFEAYPLSNLPDV